MSTENNLHKDVAVLGAAKTAYAGVGAIDLDGQTVTFAPSNKPGDTGFETQSPAKRATRLRPVIECAGTKFEKSVQTRTQPVRRADLAAFASADHSPSQFRHRSIFPTETN